MDNEEGWHYRKERIYEILVAKFRRYFNDPERTNAPKTWDDRVSSHIPISGILRRWTEAHLDEVERQAQRRQEQEQEALDDKKRAKQEAEYKSTIEKARQEYTERQNEIRSERENRQEILNRATETTQKYYKTNPQTEDTKELIASYKLDTIRIKSWIDSPFQEPNSSSPSADMIRLSRVGSVLILSKENRLDRLSATAHFSKKMQF